MRTCVLCAVIHMCTWRMNVFVCLWVRTICGRSVWQKPLHNNRIFDRERNVKVQHTLNNIGLMIFVSFRNILSVVLISKNQFSLFFCSHVRCWFGCGAMLAKEKTRMICCWLNRDAFYTQILYVFAAAGLPVWLPIRLFRLPSVCDAHDLEL